MPVAIRPLTAEDADAYIRMWSNFAGYLRNLVVAYRVRPYLREYLNRDAAPIMREREFEDSNV